MKIPFRQGIVRHQTDNVNQDFLVPAAGAVNLQVTNEHTLIHFAHLNHDYLYRETRSIIAAWVGPFVGGTDYWLYWELDAATGSRVFGHTDLEPLFGASEPSAPVVGQMWFNTATDVMGVYNGVNFDTIIRLVAAKFESAAIIQAWNGGTTFNGTQIADYTPNDAGSLLFDRTDLPLKRGDGSFITTIDGFASGIGSSSIIRIEALDFDAESAANIAAYTIVYLSDFDIILPGNPSLISNAVMGIIEEDVIPGQRVNIVTSGVIRNVSWNWTSPNSLLYIDGAGQLTDIVQPGMNPIGFTISPTSIELKTAGITEVSVIGGPSGADGVVTGGFINGSDQLVLNRSESLADVLIDISSISAVDGVIVSGITQNIGAPELVLTDSKANTVTIDLTGSGFGSGGGSSFEIVDANGDTKIYVDDSGSNDDDAVVVELGIPPFLEYHFSTELALSLEPLYFNGFVFGLSMPDIVAGQSGDGPTIEMRAGRGRGGSFAGGPLTLTAGEGNQAAAGGDASLSGGNGVNGVGPGGQATLRAGGAEDGDGGNATVIAGGSDTANGGNVNITGGSSVSATGGDVVIKSGESTSGTSGNILLDGSSGDVRVTAGTNILFEHPGGGFGSGSVIGIGIDTSAFSGADNTIYKLPQTVGAPGDELRLQPGAQMVWADPDNQMKTNISHTFITAATGTVVINTKILWTTVEQAGPLVIEWGFFDAALNSDVTQFTVEINATADGVTWPAGLIGDTSIDNGMLNLFTVSRRIGQGLTGTTFYVIKTPVNQPAPNP